jgi:hypothetical protein
MQGSNRPRLVIVDCHAIDLVEDSAQRVGDLLRRMLYTDGGFDTADLVACQFTPVAVHRAFTGHTRTIGTDTGRKVEITGAWRVSAPELYIALRLPSTEEPFRVLYTPRSHLVDGWVDLLGEGT